MKITIEMTPDEFMQIKQDKAQPKMFDPEKALEQLDKMVQSGFGAIGYKRN